MGTDLADGTDLGSNSSRSKRDQNAQTFKLLKKLIHCEQDS